MAAKRLSFRDPAGCVYASGHRIFRKLSKPYDADVVRFIEGDMFRRCSEARVFPATRVVPIEEWPSDIASEGIGAVLEHERIAFPVHAHEWTPGMLFDAGCLTLDLAEEALSEGWILKDATPWNVLFSKGRPIYCDLASFVPLPASALWMAYAQFQRTFTLPLYAFARHARSPHSILMENREGLDPTALLPTVSGWRQWKPLELALITLPSKLGSAAWAGRVAMRDDNVSERPVDREKAVFVLRRTFRRLRKQLNAVRPTTSVTKWGAYEDDLSHYSSDDRQIKAAFVQRAVSRRPGMNVLDIGANAGEYSVIAAENGANVVAVDHDLGALDRLYKRAKDRQLPISAAVLNLGRPTPAIGWNNGEVDSFLDRARGNFDLVLALAVIHHLLVTERVPLDSVLDLLAGTEAEFLAIEWVSPEDGRFRQISSLNHELYRDISEDSFRTCVERHYQVICLLYTSDAADE